MGIKGYIKHRLGFFKGISKIPDFYWYEKVKECDLDVNKIDFDPTSQGLSLKEFGITLTKEKFNFFLESLKLIRALKESAGAKFDIIDGELRTYIKDIAFNVQTSEEILILYEIFVEGIYNIITPRPIVVLDIGMNTGFASLYFSLQPHVLSVVGYEPFEKTYEQAQQNFSLNPELVRKIQPHKIGLSNVAETLTVDYCYEHKGSIGVNGVPQWLDSNQKISKESISLIHASEAIDTVRKEYPDVDIVAKIDCEGSEYEIIESLWTAGKLSSIHTFLIEWHKYQKNPTLIKYLSQAGFSIIFLEPNNQYYGMMYATRF